MSTKNESLVWDSRNRNAHKLAKMGIARTSVV